MTPTAAIRAPKGEVVRNPTRGGFTFALRFTAYNKRRYLTLGRPEDGWTETRASTELENILADVRRGIWQPHTVEAPPEPPQDPSFHEFASSWFEAIRGELRPNTVLDYEWQLRVHLLPFLKDHRLSQITVSEVDRYREAKVAEAREVEAAAGRGKPMMDEYVDRRGTKRRRPRRPLSAVSINKTITRLGQILEVAVERELIPRNPAKVGGKRRRLKAAKPARVYLDRAEQISALLDAASELDREARSNGQIARRALLATLTFAGLRISELLDLEWRDVDLAAGRLRVRHSKTDAGSRYVDLLPVLRDELSAHKAGCASTTPNVRVCIRFRHTAGRRARSQSCTRQGGQARQQEAQRRRTDATTGGPDAPRTAAHLRVGAGRARQGPPLRDGPARAHRPYGHARHLRTGNDLQRRRPRAPAVARGGPRHSAGYASERASSRRRLSVYPGAGESGAVRQSPRRILSSASSAMVV
jgi:integrase